MGIAELIIGVVAFLTFAGIYLVLRQRMAQKDIADRLKSAGKSGHKQSVNSIEREFNAEGYEAGLSDVFDMSAMLDESEYKELFTQAGWKIKNAARNALLIKATLSIGFSVIALVLINSWQRLYNQPGLTKLMLVLGAAILGFLMFGRFMKYIINKRYERISKDLHSAVELLVVCSKAGMGIEKGMERVAQEVSQYNPDLGREFMLTAIELEIMPDRKVAYENLRKRIALPLVQGMVMTLVQAEEQGSSVSESLRVLSDEFRTQVLLNFERKAAKLPATLSIPVVLFTLPTLMAVILGPAIIKLMRDTHVF